MVPAIFEPIEALPLTPSGKIDRRALPEPRQIQSLSEAFVAPRTPIEALLAAAWREVLNIEQVGIRENFFDLGGHSLLAARMVSKVRNDLDVRFTMVDVFQAPTIAGLADLIYPRVAENQTETELEFLLEEIGNLSEEEAQRRLDSELQSAVA
jgi:acyl carrier protein